MKKIIALLLSLALVLALMPSMVFADTTTTLDPSKITLGLTNSTYTGSELKPVVKYESTTLTESTDYTAAYTRGGSNTTDLTSAGVIGVTITGKGTYSGEVVLSYTILAKALVENDVTIIIPSQKTGATSLSGVTVTVTSGNIQLSSGRDFDSTITSNSGTATAGDGNTATITFKGNYSGTITDKAFAARNDISEYFNISTGTTSNYQYDGSGKTCKTTPTLVAKKTLPSGTTAPLPADYTITYTNNVNVNKTTTDVPKVTIKMNDGNTSWVGSITTNAGFTITPRSITQCTISIDNSGLPLVKDGSKTLIAGTDYSVSIVSGNYEIKGMNNYQGTKQINSRAVDLSNCTINFTGFSGSSPTFSVTHGGTTLRPYYDYTLTYSPSTGNSTYYTVAVTAVNGSSYYGTKSQYIQTPVNNIGNYTLSIAQTTHPYTGVAVKPAVTVYNGSRVVSSLYYTVTYTNNVNPGTATITITGNNTYGYYGVKTMHFTISNNYNLSNCVATLSQNTYAADGYAKTPSVTVKDGTVTLSQYTDYTVTYSSNTAPGTATILLTGKGKYLGTTKQIHFTITGLTQRISLNQYSYTKYLTSDDFTIIPTATGDGTGFSYTSSDTSVATVSYLGVVKIVGTGSAKIMVTTTGNKKYTPVTATVKITVKPKKPLIKVTSPTRQKIKVQITKVDGATKYQIKYTRNDKAFYKYITHSSSSYETQSTYLKARYSGRPYLVKVRAYKTMANGTKVWGNWTPTKKIYVK